MNDNRNMLLAIVLSALVLLGWSLLSDKFFPTAGPQTAAGRERQGQAGAAARRPARRPRRRRPFASAPRCSAKRRACRSRRRASRVRSTSRARGSTIWCWSRSARPSPRIRRRCGCCRRPARQDAYFAQFGWTGEGVAAPDANSVWTASAPVLVARQAGDAELDQPDRPAVRADRLGRRRLSVHGQAAGRQRRHRRRRASAPIGLASRADQVARSRRPGPTMSARSASSAARPIMTSTGRRSTRTSAGVTLRQPRRLARLHRQILADRAGPARRCADRGQLPQEPERRLPGRLCRRAVRRRPRPGGERRDPPVRRRQGKDLLDRYESAGITKLSKSIDWGWFEWFMRPIFDLLLWLFHATRQFRRGDHLPDLDRPRR